MLSTPSTPSAADTLVSIDYAEARGDRAHLTNTQTETLNRAQARLMQGDATAKHAVDSVLNLTVRMPIYRWDAAVKAVDKLARKAAKKNVAQPKIEEVEREVIGEGDDAETWIVARLLGAAPVLNGWRCVATLTPASVGPENAFYTNTATGQTLTPSILDTLSMRCDHTVQVVRGGVERTRSCGSRKRNLVFVIQHDDTGEVKCVGSTCLNEYLGSDALTAWFVFSRFHALGEQVRCDSWDSDAYAQWLADHPEAACRSSKAKEVPIAVRDFVACCVAHVREHGYLKSREAYQRGELATGQQVWTSYQDATHVAPTAEDYRRADDIGEWIAELSTTEYNDRGDLVYTANLAIVVRNASEHGVSRLQSNLVASAVTAYDRELERRAQQARENALRTRNEYLPFARDTPIAARLRVVRVMHWALSCVDSEGRTVLVRKRTYTDSNAPVRQGSEIIVTGKIGEQSQYLGTAQTFINAPKVYSTEDYAIV